MKMIDRITAGQDWLDRLLPEGLPVPSSTIISGPGGSGKPLVGAIFLATWLRHGGSALVFLINSDLLPMSPTPFPVIVKIVAQKKKSNSSPIPNNPDLYTGTTTTGYFLPGRRNRDGSE